MSRVMPLVAFAPAVVSSVVLVPERVVSPSFCGRCRVVSLVLAVPEDVLSLAAFSSAVVFQGEHVVLSALIVPGEVVSRFSWGAP